MPNLAEAMDAVRAALASECGCDVDAFARAAVQVFICPDVASPSPLARRYARQEPIVNIVSLGAGTVVSGSAAIVPALRAIFAGTERDTAFAVERLAAVAALLASHGLTLTPPTPRLLCADELRRDRPAPVGVTIALEAYPNERRLAELGATRWPHAFRLPVRRPNTALAVARHREDIIGVAAMSEDAPILWQIGLDVEAEFRGRGVGAALTSTLAGAALRAGCVPFYAVAPANLASVNTALAAGFRLAWVEAYSLPLDA